MKSIITIFLLSFLCSTILAQNGSITNINVNQRADGSGLVDVSFNLSGTEEAYSINLEVSFENGNSYASIPSQYLTGDVNNISPGNNKHIIWNGLESFPDYYSTQSKIKIIANPTVNPPFEWNDVFNPATGQTWMDRNLGASRAATSSTDDQAYGDLYQWGRLTDGHEKRNSTTTSSLSSSDTPSHGSFITVPSLPYDWRSPQNNNLWQGVNGTNNPCPAGYRLPTDAEWNAKRQSWSSNNAAGAFNSPLKLPVAGNRYYSNGSLLNVGSSGHYWSATVDGTYARYLFFYSSNAYMFSYFRADGYSVRCLKD